MNKTITFTESGATSGIAYRKLKDKLDLLGWNVTHWHSDKLIAVDADPGFSVWELEVEVTEQGSQFHRELHQGPGSRK